MIAKKPKPSIRGSVCSGISSQRGQHAPEYLSPNFLGGQHPPEWHAKSAFKWTSTFIFKPGFEGAAWTRISNDELNSERPFCVVEKDGLRVNLFQDKKHAEEHNPEFRLLTDDIEEVYEKVKSKYPELLHPNLNVITLRPWGAQEFALMDEQIGIIIQKW